MAECLSEQFSLYVWTCLPESEIYNYISSSKKLLLTGSDRNTIKFAIIELPHE